MTNEKRILHFLKKYRNKTVVFKDLAEDEKYSYVLCDSFNYFNRLLPLKEAIKRSTTNADMHRENNYEYFVAADDHIFVK